MEFFGREFEGQLPAIPMTPVFRLNIFNMEQTHFTVNLAMIRNLQCI